MTPQTSTIIALILLGVGAAASLIMWELKGNNRAGSGDAKLRLTHRALGYLFVVLFAFMLYTMIVKVSGYREELSARAVIHISFALSLLVLLGLKLWIVRRLHDFSEYLFPVGTIMLIFMLIMVGITGGYFLLHRSDVRYITIAEHDRVVLDEEIGRAIMFNKCNKCHTFERILLVYKNEAAWLDTINRMAVYDAPNLTDFDIKQVTHFILNYQQRRQGQDPARVDEEIGRSLVNERCSRCHSLDRVYGAQKNRMQWLATIERMAGYAQDPAFLSGADKAEVLRFLTRKGTASVK